jgi:NlpC/P60 family putative phage cell wall peptidase
MNDFFFEPQDVIEEARRWIGTPYRHQSALRGIGCDCIGLIRGVWHALGAINPPYIPPYTPHGECEWGSLDQGLERYLKKSCSLNYYLSDLLVFRWRTYLPANHVGIVSIQDGEESWMIHAHQGAVVAEVPLNSWWKRHLSCVFKISNRDLVFKGP